LLELTGRRQAIGFAQPGTWYLPATCTWLSETKPVPDYDEKVFYRAFDLSYSTIQHTQCADVPEKRRDTLGDINLRWYNCAKVTNVDTILQRPVLQNYLAGSDLS
jgi:hypothetical protein